MAGCGHNRSAGDAAKISLLRTFDAVLSAGRHECGPSVTSGTLGAHLLNFGKDADGVPPRVAHLSGSHIDKEDRAYNLTTH